MNQPFARARWWLLTFCFTLAAALILPWSAHSAEHGGDVQPDAAARHSHDELRINLPALIGELETVNPEIKAARQ